MIMERAWFSKVLEKRTLRGKGRKDIIIKLNPTFNPNSQNRVRISWREEFFVFWVDDEMLKACIPFYFLIFDENNIPRNERQRGRKLSLNSRIECRMGRKNPFCCELMIKWREIRVQRAWCAFLRIVERLDTFISLSLFLCLSLCAFPFRTSVRWWKRGLYCALCSLLKYSRDDCSRRKRNFWLKNGIASRETPLSSVPLNNELQTSASRGESVKNARDEIFLSFLFLFSLFPPPFFSFSLIRLRVETSEHFFRWLRGEFKEIVFRRNTVFSIRVTRSLDLPFPKRRKFNKRITTNCSSAIQ